MIAMENFVVTYVPRDLQIELISRKDLPVDKASAFLENIK